MTYGHRTLRFIPRFPRCFNGKRFACVGIGSKSDLKQLMLYLNPIIKGYRIIERKFPVVYEISETSSHVLYVYPNQREIIEAFKDEILIQSDLKERPIDWKCPEIKSQENNKDKESE